MARNVTLTTLEQRVLRRANIQANGGGATFPAIYPQVECDDDINEGCADLWDELRQAMGEDFPKIHVPWTTSNTTDSSGNYIATIGVDIPAPDFLEFRGLDITFGNSSTPGGNQIVITAKQGNWSERNKYKWWPTWVYSQPVFYHLTGNQLFLWPPPGGSFACTFWYTQTCPKLINGADFIDAINGWEEFAVLFAAARAQMKRERIEHAQSLLAMREDIRARIRNMGSRRNAEAPPRVQDVYLNDGYVGRPGY